MHAIDLHLAREELRSKTEQLHNDDGTTSALDIRLVTKKVKMIEGDLKKRAIVMGIDMKTLHAELDRLFPDAKSKEIVEHEGRRYQRRFYPLTESIPAVRYSKWEGTWEDLGAVA